MTPTHRRVVCRGAACATRRVIVLTSTAARPFASRSAHRWPEAKHAERVCPSTPPRAVGLTDALRSALPALKNP
jgi:hypothetical protein